MSRTSEELESSLAAQRLESRQASQDKVDELSKLFGEFIQTYIEEHPLKPYLHLPLSETGSVEGGEDKASFGEEKTSVGETVLPTTTKLSDLMGRHLAQLSRQSEAMNAVLSGSGDEAMKLVVPTEGSKKLFEKLEAEKSSTLYELHSSVLAFVQGL